MITHAELPHELNLATWFVDRNVEEGRGDRTALISAKGPTTYAELARLVNRYGNLLRELGHDLFPRGADAIDRLTSGDEPILVSFRGTGYSANAYDAVLSPAKL